ncbi:hypothetical protein Rhola_00002850 [Rhodoluna lacicola]|uniref:Uncharacterized protein n=1 Tax=Rhodoluna lacicola TaxID=529884 RepID=A0A060JKI8_9MICO|nr:hypothetical protein Rhola_00002850 [Rhodoluna lacicola]
MFFVPTERFPALQSSRLKQAALKTVARREKPQRNLGLFHSGEYGIRTSIPARALGCVSGISNALGYSSDTPKCTDMLQKTLISVAASTSNGTFAWVRQRQLMRSRIRGNFQQAFTLPGRKFTQGIVLKSTINFDCYIFELFIDRNEFSALSLVDHHQLATESWRKYLVSEEVVIYRKEVLSENGIIRSVRSISRIFEHLGVDFEVGDK